MTQRRFLFVDPSFGADEREPTEMALFVPDGRFGVRRLKTIRLRGGAIEQAHAVLNATMEHNAQVIIETNGPGTFLRQAFAELRGHVLEKKR